MGEMLKAHWDEIYEGTDPVLTLPPSKLDLRIRFSIG